MAAILLIEDVPIVRDTLRKFLERGGHKVTECGGGDEASTLIGRQTFDAVVTDIWMKDGDGLEFIHRLRAKNPTIPVIAITGGDPRSPQSSSGDNALRAGASRVLMKPVTKSLLLDTVAEFLTAKANAVQ